MLSSIATLAYDCRRPEFFTEQLYAALKLIDRGVLSGATRGSMHGEVGQTQFMPKNILAYGTSGATTYGGVVAFRKGSYSETSCQAACHISGVNGGGAGGHNAGPSGATREVW